MRPEPSVRDTVLVYGHPVMVVRVYWDAKRLNRKVLVQDGEHQEELFLDEIEVGEPTLSNHP